MIPEEARNTLYAFRAKSGYHLLADEDHLALAGRRDAVTAPTTICMTNSRRIDQDVEGGGQIRFAAARTFSSSSVLKFLFLRRSRTRVVSSANNVHDFGRTQCLLQFRFQMTRQKIVHDFNRLQLLLSFGDWRGITNRKCGNFPLSLVLLLGRSSRNPTGTRTSSRASERGQKLYRR